MLPPDMRLLILFEDENSKLHKLGADLVARSGDAAGRYLPKIVRFSRKCKLVNGFHSDCCVSIRWAYQVLEKDISTYHYQSRRRGQAGIEASIREIFETRVRSPRSYSP